MKSTLITRVVAGALVAASAFVSTNYLFAQSTTAPAAPAATAPGTTPILAVVNGQEISKDKFDQLLMSVAGMRLFEQVVDLIVAERACLEAGIDINAPAFQKSVQAELDRALGDIGASGVPEEQRSAALAQILRNRGITNAEFQMGLRRGACLRALAQGKVTITDKDVEDAYNAQYGERLQGVLFHVRSLEDASDIRKLLTEQGKDIAEVAQTRGGQTIVLAKSDDRETVKTLKDAAFRLNEKQLSAALEQPDKSLLLFYVVKKLPAQPEVKLDAALKEKLHAALQEQNERAWANAHLADLRRMATIKINDPVLSRQYEEAYKQMQANATQNASQPAATGAATPK